MPVNPWPADDDDHWLHHVLVGGAVRATKPRVKVRYIQNRFKEVRRPGWEAEMSGRLLSAARDIRERAEKVAASLGNPKIYSLRHVIHVPVVEVRRNPNLDVYAEPTEPDNPNHSDHDPAHANLVIKVLPRAPQAPGADPKPSHEIFRQIADLLEVCDAPNLSPIELLRRS